MRCFGRIFQKKFPVKFSFVPVCDRGNIKKYAFKWNKKAHAQNMGRKKDGYLKAAATATAS